MKKCISRTQETGCGCVYEKTGHGYIGVRHPAPGREKFVNVKQERIVMRFKASVFISLLALISFVTGCSGVKVLVATEEFNVTRFTVGFPQSDVLDAALKVSQGMNLDVMLIEKDSGLIRYESAGVSAHELQRYCWYPYNNSEGKPFDTFTNWDRRSREYDKTAVRGSLQMTVLVSPADGGSLITIRSRWTAANNLESYRCKSTEVFEGDFVEAIKSHLGRN